MPANRRFRDRGPLVPTGLSHVSSWVHDELDRCYQLMETEDRTLFDKWIANWNDIIDFKVHPVISSKEESECNVRHYSPPPEVSFLKLSLS